MDTGSSLLRLRIVSPEGPVVDTEVRSVVFPGEDGEFGILPRHAAMVSLTESGILHAELPDGSRMEYVVHDGFAEVRDNVVTVLSRSAEKPEAIDLERARRAAERAMERLRADRTEIDLARAQIALRRALMREKAARRRASR